MLLFEIATVYFEVLPISRYDGHFGLLGHRSKATLDMFLMIPFQCEPIDILL